MDTTDVDPDADRTEVRFTSHQFKSLKPVAGPSGSALRVPSDLSCWPPTALFEAVYASAVVHHFGFTAVTDIPEKWVDVFYPGGLVQAAYADRKSRHDQADKGNSDGQQATQQRRYERRYRKRNKHNAVDSHDAFMRYRFKAMGPEKTRTYLKECEEMLAARERKGLEEKVNLWRASLAPLNDTTVGLDDSCFICVEITCVLYSINGVVASRPRQTETTRRSSHDTTQA